MAIATKFGFRFDQDGRQVGLSSHPDHIHQAVDGSLQRLAAATIALTTDDLSEIDHTTAQIQVQGARYPDHLQQLIDR